MTNNNIPQSHHSESNQGLSVTGTVESPYPSSERPENTDLREIVIIPDSTATEGSQDNPILVDSTPEPTVSPTIKPRHSRPRRNVGPPQFYGNRRFIDVVLEKDYTGVSPSLFPSPPDIPYFHGHITVRFIDTTSGGPSPTNTRCGNDVILVIKEFSPDGQTSNFSYEDSFPRKFLGLKLSLPDHEGLPARGRQL